MKFSKKWLKFSKKLLKFSKKLLKLSKKLLKFPKKLLKFSKKLLKFSKKLLKFSKKLLKFSKKLLQNLVRDQGLVIQWGLASSKDTEGRLQPTQDSLHKIFKNKLPLRTYNVKFTNLTTFGFDTSNGLTIMFSFKVWVKILQSKVSASRHSVIPSSPTLSRVCNILHTSISTFLVNGPKTTYYEKFTYFAIFVMILQVCPAKEKWHNSRFFINRVHGSTHVFRVYSIIILPENAAVEWTVLPKLVKQNDHISLFPEKTKKIRCISKY